MYKSLVSGAMKSSVESLLNRYIPSVTIVGGIIIGLLASVSNVFNVFGSGIGMLLMVDILVNYYNLLVREQVDVHMPKLATLLGRDWNIWPKFFYFFSIPESFSF